MHSFHHCQHLCQSGTYIEIDEPMLKNNHHPKYIVYSMVHAWCRTLYESGQMYNEIYP